MLIVSRRLGQGLVIGEDIDIDVVELVGRSRGGRWAVQVTIHGDIRVLVSSDGRVVKFAVDAPRAVSVLRKELLGSRASGN